MYHWAALALLLLLVDTARATSDETTTKNLAIAGIVICAVVLAVALVVTIYLVYKWTGHKKNHASKHRDREHLVSEEEEEENGTI